MRAPAVAWLSIVALLAAVGPASAQLAGGGTLSGRSTLAVGQCGTDRGGLVTTMALSTAGTWTAGTEEGGTFGGSFTPLGKAGRKAALQLDAAATAGITAMLTGDIGRLCGVSVTITTISVKKARLSLNRARTTAKLVLLVRASGRASNGGKGSATWRVTAKGAWTAA